MLERVVVVEPFFTTELGVEFKSIVAGDRFSERRLSAPRWSEEAPDSGLMISAVVAKIDLSVELETSGVLNGRVEVCFKCSSKTSRLNS